MSHILLIDDDEDMLAMTGRWLEKAGYTVTKAQSGKEALEMLAVENPDLILLDYAMPGMNGPQVLRQIRSRSDCSNVKVDNTVIRDCSDGGVNLSYTDDAHFTDCDIVRCGNGDATVTALFSNNMTFDRCRFAENTGSFLFWLNKEPVTLNNCEVHYMNELSNKQSLLKGNTKWHKDANPLTPRAIGPK